MANRGLFIRTVAVEAGAPGEQGSRYDDLRVAFRVSHRAGGSPSTAGIEITNLAESSVQVFKPRTNVIRLLVGYDGDERIIFQGNPRRDGVDFYASGSGDRVLTVEASDGGRGFTGAVVRRQYSTSVAWSQVLQDVLDETGWARGEIALPEVSTPGPLVCYDKPEDLLDRISELVPGGGEWFVRDNALHIIARGDSTKEVALLISQQQGNLIGAPTSTRKGCRVRALIDASFRPLMPFQVESDLLEGSFIATDVEMSGDSWGNDFYMTITGKRRGVK